MALAEESIDMSSGFSDGLEFEETFPESAPAPAAVPPAAAAVPPAPRAVERERPERAEALFEEQLAKRLREAEEMVKETVERMRVEEEQRLAEWVRQRREEEERRVQRWVEERRAAVERTLDQRRSTEDALATRLQDMLGEWEARFDERLEQRRADDERMAERRRQTDEERLRAWRAELEQALSARFAEPRGARSPLPDRNGELRTALRDAVAASTSVRDVGRVLRDVLGELAQTSAFAVAVHHRGRPEVAYRYRVASDDEVGQELRGDALDDGPESAAAHAGSWVRGQRTMRLGGRNVVVHTAQAAVVASGAAVGVLTLQTADREIADAVLARVSDLVALAAPRIAELRDGGRFRGA